jgi:hypothetical protein
MATPIGQYLMFFFVVFMFMKEARFLKNHPS